MPQDVVIVLSLGGYTPKSSKVRQSPVSMARVLLPLRSTNTAGGTGGSGIAVTGSGSDYIFKPTPSRYAMLAMVDVWQQNWQWQIKRRRKIACGG